MAEKEAISNRNADRVDFVLCKQLSPVTWLVNYYEIER